MIWPLEPSLNEFLMIGKLVSTNLSETNMLIFVIKNYDPVYFSSFLMTSSLLFETMLPSGFSNTTLGINPVSPRDVSFFTDFI